MRFEWSLEEGIGFLSMRTESGRKGILKAGEKGEEKMGLGPSK